MKTDKGMLKLKRNKFGVFMRLQHQADFDRVFATGRRYKAKGLLFLAAPGDLDHPRFGISIGRTFGSAVERNRIKRKLREAFRLIRCELPPCDIVCVPKRPAAQLTVTELKELIGKACESSRIVQNMQ